MPDWLSISVTFPNGRYHGHEWPPSPARLFQALLAGIMTGQYREQWEAARPVLEWLERQPAPIIVACDTQPTPPYRLAVPNNDLDIAAREWRKAKAYDAALLRTLKTVRPRDLGSGATPHVRYLWAVEEASKQWTGRLRALADCLHTLGWGVDMAYADTQLLSDTEALQAAGQRWMPAPRGGSVLRVPLEGSLDDLRDAYQRFTNRISKSGVDPDTRASVYGLQGYRREGEGRHPFAAFALKTPDGSRALARSGRDVMIVAAWLRHACAEALKQEGEPEEWVDRYVHGHEQEKSTGHHMSFVPLPTIGHPNADGRIRRALVIEPLEAEGRAVNLLEVKLSGEVISGEDGSCQLVAPEAADPVLDRYLCSARVWRSVTPVVLHGFNIVRGKIGVAKTERLLLAALEFGGHPASLVEGLAFQPAPLWSGAEASARVQVPAHLEKWPRYHVEVRFREKVAGPVFAGIGRHCGLGIFAAAE